MSEEKKRAIYQEQNCYSYDSNGNPYLIGSKCKYCGYIAFPEKIICPACITQNSMFKIPVGSKGTIDSFSVLHVGAPGFETPYILAWVKTKEGAKVLTIIVGCKPEEASLEIGMEVELLIDKIRKDKQGNDIRGYVFKPLSNRNGRSQL